MSEPRKDAAAVKESTPPEQELDSVAAPPFREPLPSLSGASSPPRLDFLAPAETPDELGRLGPYHVLKVLGAGGMGLVLLALDPVLKRQVAIKVMRPEVATDQNARQRFLREARAAAALDHPHIVPIHHVGDENGVPFMVMPLLKGESLDQRLVREKHLPIAHAVVIGKQIADGLAEAHKNGLIHRDIKPSNIILSALTPDSCPLTPIVKIVDFGLAAVAGDDVHLTKTGTVLGTPAYMSPEQARGNEVDFRSDLFSLGGILYRMLTNELPFKGRDTMSMLMSLAADTPAPVRSLNSEVPPALADLVMQLLAKEAGRRPPSAQAVAETLGEIAGDKTTLLSERSAFSGQLSAFSRQPKLTAGIRMLALLLALLVALLVLAISLPFLTPRQEGVNPKHDQPQGQEPAKGFTNSLDMKFMPIPAGKFTMGSSKQEIGWFLEQPRIKDSGWAAEVKAEAPEHEVEITRPFYMAATPVTVAQFRRFVTEKKYQVGNDLWTKTSIAVGETPGFVQADDHPVVNVSRQNAFDFCAWLSQHEGKTYRLPTEAEWEYCCRAGKNGRRYCFGNDPAELAFYGWYGGSGGKADGSTHPVRTLRANDWGLFDMHGNVWQWCQDIYAANYYQSSPKQNPTGPLAGSRLVEGVARGGGWRAYYFHCRCAFRYHMDPERQQHDIGFRVVCEAGP